MYFNERDHYAVCAHIIYFQSKHRICELKNRIFLQVFFACMSLQTMNIALLHTDNDVGA